MGNPTHASDEDYQLYARPKDGLRQDSVQLNSAQIVDDGAFPPHGGTDRGGRAAPGADGRPAPDGDSACAAGETRGTETNGRPGVGGAQGTLNPGGLTASEGPGRRWVNPYLCAAWVLVAVLLIAGLMWITGGLEPDRYASYLEESSSGQANDGPRGPFALNLYSLGPIPLLLGVMGAFTLLTVQAGSFRRGVPLWFSSSG